MPCRFQFRMAVRVMCLSQLGKRFVSVSIFSFLDIVFYFYSNDSLLEVKSIFHGWWNCSNFIELWHHSYIKLFAEEKIYECHIWDLSINLSISRDWNLMKHISWCWCKYKKEQVLSDASKGYRGKQRHVGVCHLHNAGQYHNTKILNTLFQARKSLYIWKWQ